MLPSGFFNTFASDKDTHLKPKGEIKLLCCPREADEKIILILPKYLTSRPHFLTCRLRSAMISEAQMFFSFTNLLTFNLVSRQTLSMEPVFQWNLFFGKKPHEDRFGKRAKNVLILKLKIDLNFRS